METNLKPGFFDELAGRIAANPGFQKDLDDLKKLYLLPHNLSNNFLENIDFVKRLAETTGVLERSENAEYKKLALEIATLLVESGNIKEEFPGVEGVLKIISSRLGNIPAIRLISSVPINLPRTLEAETEDAKLENTLRIYGANIEVTNFQKQVLMDLSSKNSLSISAPTSGGKSFIIKRYVAELLLKENTTIAYIVPTRALISQVQHDFIELFSTPVGGNEQLIQSTQFLTTTEEDLYDREISKTLFILTQERLITILLGWKEKPVFDLVIVDEVQKISEGGRGIILENVLSSLANSSLNSHLKFAFLSPFTSNPERIFNLIEFKSANMFRTGVISPVAQHIYTVNGDSSGKSLNLGFISQGKNRDIGNLEIDNNLQSLGNKIDKNDLDDYNFCKIIISLSQKKSSLVYAPSPKKVIDIASKLVESMAQENSTNSKLSNVVQDAIDRMEIYIHKDYNLIKFLKAGVAYHYGSMPEMARHIVEDLFAKEEIRFLVCTSTLLEGVNLPAKYIFISKPLAGKTYLSMGAFWNLAGRAGRMQSEISGTVFCVNTREWKTKFYENRKGYFLESAFKDILETSNFLEYTSNLNTQTYKKDFPVALNILIEKYISKGRKYLENFIANRAKLDPKIISQLIASIEELIEKLQFPPELVPLNTNIDIRLQKELLNQFLNLDSNNVLESIPLPVHSGEFYNRLENIFRICQDAFAIPEANGDKKAGKQYKYFCLLASKWIREDTLKQIIDNQIAYKENGAKGKPNNQVEIDANDIITKIIDTLNNTIRFTYQNYTKCYGDLLIYSLKSRGLFEQYDSAIYTGIPNNLELGLNKKLSISLHRAGFSRNAAILISEQVEQLGLKVEGKKPAQFLSELREIGPKVMTSLDRFTQNEYRRLIK